VDCRSTVRGQFAPVAPDDLAVSGLGIGLYNNPAVQSIMSVASAMEWVYGVNVVVAAPALAMTLMLIARRRRRKSLNSEA
jgi:hypothetical protein